MKKIKIHLALLGIISTLLTIGCNNTNKNVESEIAFLGNEIIDSAITIHLQFANFALNDQNNTGLVMVLANPSDSLGALEIIPVNNNLNIEILKSYKQLFNEYSVTSEKDLKDSKASFSNLVVSTCILIDSASKEYKATTEPLMANVMSVKINQTEFLLQMTQLLLSIYKNDLLNWQMQLNENFSKFQKKLLATPAESFDEEKLAKFIYQPYSGKRIMVQVYKQSLIEEVYLRNSTFYQQNQNLILCMESLQFAMSEYLKKQSDKVIVNQYLDKVKLNLNLPLTIKE